MENVNDQPPEKPELHLLAVSGRFLRTILLYLRVVIMQKNTAEGYEFREVGNLPIVGVNHFKGVEMINPVTNKVVYSLVMDYGYISGLYDPFKFKLVSKFFFKNAR